MATVSDAGCRLCLLAMPGAPAGEDPSGSGDAGNGDAALPATAGPEMAGPGGARAVAAGCMWQPAAWGRRHLRPEIAQPSLPLARQCSSFHKWLHFGWCHLYASGGNCRCCCCRQQRGSAGHWPVRQRGRHDLEEHSLPPATEVDIPLGAVWRISLARESWQQRRRQVQDADGQRGHSQPNRNRPQELQCHRQVPAPLGMARRAPLGNWHRS
mmetsp:Transcript_23491/g.73881  ORF Transcript_23491/g.73881 Transcript_23491/m.73881 type:complete len:212 (+) Transcript_23491:100-735(+)